MPTTDTLNAFDLDDMYQWITDCYGIDSAESGIASDADIVAFVNSHYSGGITGFMSTRADRNDYQDRAIYFTARAAEARTAGRHDEAAELDAAAARCWHSHHAA